MTKGGAAFRRHRLVACRTGGHFSVWPAITTLLTAIWIVGSACAGEVHPSAAEVTDMTPGGTDTRETLLSKGARIRIWSPKLQKNPQVAVVETVEDEQLILTMPNRTELVRASYEDLDRLEISVSPGSNNALTFAVAGAAIVGFTLLILSDSQTSGRSDEDVRGLAFGLGLLAGGALGAVIGVATSSPEVWEEVSLPRSDGANYEPSEVKRVGIVLATF